MFDFYFLFFLSVKVSHNSKQLFSPTAACVVKNSKCLTNVIYYPHYSVCLHFNSNALQATLFTASNVWSSCKPHSYSLHSIIKALTGTSFYISPITHLFGAASLVLLHFDWALRNWAAISLQTVRQKQTCSRPPILCIIQSAGIIYSTYIFIVS